MGIFKQFRLILIGVLIVSNTGLAFAFMGLSQTRETIELENYITLLRGSSQRAIKLELLGQSSDEIIQDIEKSFKKSKREKERISLSFQSKDFYDTRLTKLTKDWESLKQLIKKSRKDSRLRTQLGKDSEEFWKTCTQAISEAQAMSRKSLQRLLWIEASLILVNVIALLLFFSTSEKIATQVRDTLAFVTSYTGDLLATIEKQERGIHQQALSVNETTVTVDELKASSHKATENSNLAAKQADRVTELADRGDRLVEQTLVGVVNIKEQVDSIAEQIQNLSQQTAQIGQISTWVKELATQTNVLALNANIEAVRAGDSGQEFSVVAREIRQLAAQSQQAGEKISAIVSEIQATILKTVKVTSVGTHKAIEGEQTARETAAAFMQVKFAIEQITIAAREIANSAGEQLIALQQISESMSCLNQSATETVTEIRQTQTETQKFTELMLNLRNLMG
jgi:methyl-accepting chemotaxis protein